MTGPLVLIVLGVLLLLNNLYPEVYRFSRVWPVIFIVIGIAKVLESLAHRGKSPEGPESNEGPDGNVEPPSRKESE